MQGRYVEAGVAKRAERGAFPLANEMKGILHCLRTFLVFWFALDISFLLNLLKILKHVCPGPTGKAEQPAPHFGGASQGQKHPYESRWSSSEEQREQLCSYQAIKYL